MIFRNFCNSLCTSFLDLFSPTNISNIIFLPISLTTIQNFVQKGSRLYTLNTWGGSELLSTVFINNFKIIFLYLSIQTICPSKLSVNHNYLWIKTKSRPKKCINQKTKNEAKRIISLIIPKFSMSYSVYVAMETYQ